MDMKLSEIDFYKVYRKWIDDLDAFKCFFRSINFVSLKHFPDFQLSNVPEDGGNYFETINSYLKKYSFNDTLFIIDINGNEAIRTAYFTRKMLSLAPVMVFNGVLHPFGLIGDKTYISHLIGYGMQNEKINKKGYLIVLDSNRYNEYSDDELKENFNNQYELGEEDLPSIEMLELFGYKKIVYIYENNVKEDLECYLDHFSQSSIDIEKIDLSNQISL